MSIVERRSSCKSSTWSLVLFQSLGCCEGSLQDQDVKLFNLLHFRGRGGNLVIFNLLRWPVFRQGGTQKINTVLYVASFSARSILETGRRVQIISSSFLRSGELEKMQGITWKQKVTGLIYGQDPSTMLTLLADTTKVVEVTSMIVVALRSQGTAWITRQSGRVILQ